MWSTINWSSWRTVLKLDPDKMLPVGFQQIVSHPAVDAIIIGGTQNITPLNTGQLFTQVAEAVKNLPIIQELSDLHAVLPGVDGYLLPVVLNAGSTDWLLGQHLEAVKKYRELMDWSKILPEAYLILNPHCAAAKLTAARQLSREDVLAYVTLAEEMLGFPIVYLEYSGTYGNPELVETVGKIRKKARIFYGGGIKSEKHVREMTSLADTIVLGNVLYDQFEEVKRILDSMTGIKGKEKTACKR